MSKTLGNELYDLLNPYDPSAGANPATWDQTDEDFQAHYERCAVQFRDAIIDECAKVADGQAEYREVWNERHTAAALMELAEEIRSLKDTPTQREGEDE